jgi:hypothetical protein
MATCRSQRLTRIKHNRMRREIQTRIRSARTPWLDYTDRRGRVINLFRWAHLWGRWSYRLVARTDIGDHHVLTIWLGHGFPEERFETAVRLNDRLDVVGHWPTEEQALEGHARAALGLRKVVCRVCGSVRTAENVDDVVTWWCPACESSEQQAAPDAGGKIALAQNQTRW